MEHHIYGRNLHNPAKKEQYFSHDYEIFNDRKPLRYKDSRMFKVIEELQIAILRDINLESGHYLRQGGGYKTKNLVLSKFAHPL